jgi:hypothetical protein
VLPVIALGARTISAPPSLTNARLAAQPKTSQADPEPSLVMGATCSGTEASEMPTLIVPEGVTPLGGVWRVDPLCAMRVRLNLEAKGRMGAV